MRTIRFATAVVFAAALAGCSSHAAATHGGGSGPAAGQDSTSAATDPTPTTWASPAMSIAAITKGLGIHDYQPNVPVFTADISGRSEPLLCNVAVVINTKENVAMYVDAGDNVATNKAQTIGVKFSGGAFGDKPDDIPACGMALNEAIAALGNGS